MQRLSRIHRRVASLARQRGFVRLPSFIARWGSQRFRPQDLFRSGEPGAHFEAYDAAALGPTRVNLLTYSNFGGATAGTPGTAPTNWSLAFNTGTTAIAGEAATLSTSGAARQVWASPSFTLIPGEVATLSVEITAASGAAGEVIASCNVSAGAVTGTTTLTVGGGTGRRSMTVTGGAAGATIQFRIGPGSAANTSGATSATFQNPQIEKAAAFTAYQRVTDWNTEYLAAVGAENIGMWQDATGSTPVTGIEQAIGLWRDSRKGLSFGADVKGLGAPALSGAATGATYNTASGVGTANRVDASNQSYIQFNGLVSGSYYRAEIANTGAVSISIRAGGSGGTVLATINPGGTFGGLVLCSAGQLSITSGGGAVTFTLSTLKEAPGNHATQSTANSRPILSARVSLLQKTEQLTDAAWTKAGAGVATAPTVAGGEVAPDGTTTAFKVSLALNGGTTSTDFTQLNCTGLSLTTGASYKHGFWIKAFAVGDVGKIVLSRHAAGAVFTQIELPANWTFVSWNEVGNSAVTVTALVALRGGTGSADSASCVVWHPDLRTADDAAKDIPAYQRVNTAADYDWIGFPFYLKFDGLDDSLQTPAIDCSALNKMSVWVGATKLSDSATAVVFELGASSSVGGTAGSVGVLAPNGASEPNYRFQSGGTSPGASIASNNNYSAPNSSVVTGLGDIGAPNSEIRINGVGVRAVATSQGTGNYANAALNIGRRNNASSPYNGRIYSLTLRASSTPASEGFIAKMNRYAANLMKVAI